MGEETTKDEERDKQSFLYRVGYFGSTVGKKAPRKRSTRLMLQGGLAFLVFAFLVFTVASQWSELREKGVEFNLLWLIPALIAISAYYAGSAAVWGLILRFMGTAVPPGETQKIWAQPLLVRYIPGTVLFVLARVLMAEKAGVSRRVSTAGLVYEQAVSIAAAMTIASYFVIAHPDLQGTPLRWVPLLVTPLLIGFLQPRIFGPVSHKLLSALGREPLPRTIAFGAVLTLFAAYLILWSVMGVGVYFAARSVHFLYLADLPIVAASQMIGFLAAVFSAVTPAGLGVRDAAFAWAVKIALPSSSFGVGATIAIAVRATQTVAELIYVGIVTAAARWSGKAEEEVIDVLKEEAQAD